MSTFSFPPPGWRKKAYAWPRAHANFERFSFRSLPQLAGKTPRQLLLQYLAGCGVAPLIFITAAILWTIVQGTIHTRTSKNKLPFPVHVAGVFDQNRPGRAFLRPTLSGDVPSLSLDHGKKRTGPPDHRTSFLEVATSSSSVRSAGVDRG